jgi:hypothetical protein
MEAYKLVSDGPRMQEGFAAWIKALIAHATKQSKQVWWLSAERIMLKVQPALEAGNPTKRISLAYDGTGKSWTVQINPAIEPGDANRLSGVGEDESGRLWILRQGFLRPNNESPEIKWGEFRQATGLIPVHVTVASGPTDREWYPVALLNSSADDICSQTAAFVARCSEARVQFGYTKGSPQDTAAINQLFGSPEIGGGYWIGSKPPTEKVFVSRKQGQVWAVLAKELEQVGKTLRKPRHAIGYETDGVIEGTPDMLIEIKSDVSAGSVYAGVGQLLLYRQLMPSLLNYKPVLLLPAKPTSVLADAVTNLGIILETYELSSQDAISFSPSFRNMCGLIN